MLKTVKNMFQDANKDFLRVWYHSWKWLLPLAVSLKILHVVMMRIAGEFGPDWARQVVDGIMSLGESGVYILVLPVVIYWVKQKQIPGNVWQHFQKFVSPLTIESLRVIGKISVGFLFFIIPGFYRVVSLFFVPWIVQFHVPYLEGKVDALEHSTTLVKGRFWKVLFLLIVPNIVSLLSLVEYYVSDSSPWIVPAFLLTLFVQIYTQIMLFSLYTNLESTHVTKI